MFGAPLGCFDGLRNLWRIGFEIRAADLAGKMKIRTRQMLGCARHVCCLFWLSYAANATDRTLFLVRSVVC